MASLMSYVQRILRKVASIQLNYTLIFTLAAILFTIFSLFGAFNITLQSDLAELNPQDIPVTKLQNEINTDFNRFESVVVLIEIDRELDSDIQDIRDPAVIQLIVDLDQKLREEKSIREVTSPAIFFQEEIPDSLEEVKSNLSQIPGSEDFFDRSFEWTVIFIEADVGGDNVKIQALNKEINKIIETTNVPGGIKITTTGDAPLNSAIFNLLINDAFFTLIFATVLIFILIFIIERSLKQGLIVMFPLAIGLIWTMGTMGWLGIPITIATAAMGAMLLGLGVEYSIFLFSRYKEERKTKTLEEALPEASSTVGATLVSSGSTTLIGFLALSLSIFPVLSDLGLTLALGIGFMLSSTILILPLAIIFDERIEKRLKGEKEIIHQLKEEEKEAKKLGITKFYRGYGKLVANRPLVVLLVAMLITLLMFVGIQQIKNQDVDFETILPDDLDEILAFIKITDEFGDDSSILIHVAIDPQFPESDEPQDIRDPRVIGYVDTLTQKSRNIQDFVSVSSISEMVKDANEGVIPSTIASEREIFETARQRNIINDDYSATLIRISVSEDAIEDSEEVVNQVINIIEETEKPAGITTRPSGGAVVESELDALNQPDSQRTSLLALIGIVVFLYLLTRSVKSTFLPLLTVVLSIVWILGLTGFFQVPFNNITQSVLTMIIGIGIDFGLQVVNRFNQEASRHPKKKAIEITLAGILTPMIITVVAAVIGFRAMGLGQLKVMNDLGILMSFGITSSMIVAITFVASITFLLHKEKKVKK